MSFLMPFTRRRESPLALFLGLMLIACALLVTAPKAQAGYSVIATDVVIASGETSQTETIDLSGVVIKDVIAYVPTLDSGDTSTVTLRNVLNNETYSPVGWSDKGIGATEDGALVKCLAAVATIPASGSAQITARTSTAQAADRSWIIYLIVED